MEIINVILGDKFMINLEKLLIKMLMKDYRIKKRNEKNNKLGKN